MCHVAGHLVIDYSVNLKSVSTKQNKKTRMEVTAHSLLKAKNTRSRPHSRTNRSAHTCTRIHTHACRHTQARTHTLTMPIHSNRVIYSFQSLCFILQMFNLCLNIYRILHGNNESTDVRWVHELSIIYQWITKEHSKMYQCTINEQCMNKHYDFKFRYIRRHYAVYAENWNRHIFAIYII